MVIVLGHLEVVHKCLKIALQHSKVVPKYWELALEGLKKALEQRKSYNHCSVDDLRVQRGVQEAAQRRGKGRMDHRQTQVVGSWFEK